MYADDTHSLTFASIDVAHLEEDLAKVYERLMAENLTSKKLKTEFMLIESNVCIRQIVSTKSPGPGWSNVG